MLSLYCVHTAILPFLLANKNMCDLDLNAGPESSMIMSLLEHPWGPSCFQSHSIKAGCLNSLILEESGPRLPTTSSWFQVQEPETSFQGAQKGFVNEPLAHDLVINLYLLITIAFILFQTFRDSSLVSYQMLWDCYSHETFVSNIEFLGPVMQHHLKHFCCSTFVLILAFWNCSYIYLMYAFLEVPQTCT